MTDEQITIAVAKLDGWLDVKEYTYTYDYAGEQGSYKRIQGRSLANLGHFVGLPAYLTSRDAIIPVIESQLGDNEERWSKFLHELGKLVGFHLGMEVPRWNLMKRFMFATPRQLCIALLKETNQYDP